MTPATPSPSRGAGDARDRQVPASVCNTTRSTEPAPGTRRSCQARWHVVAGTPAEHIDIHQFLIGVAQQPSPAEFQAQLDNPFYEPSHRLLLKKHREIIAHLRTAPAELRFGDQVLPIAWVEDVVTQPGYRGHGCGSALLAAAQKRLAEDGTILALLRTDLPRFYAARGWVVCGRHSYTTAAPRAILSQLATCHAEQTWHVPSVLDASRRRKYAIRMWRHVEQDALARLYAEATTDAYGALLRTEPYWRWLIGRRGYERIYVALDGREHSSLAEQVASVVGYAVVRQGRIVELTHAADHPEAGHQLLARACGDAIERDIHRIQFDGPPHHPLHEALIQAGGTCSLHEVDRGHVFMARLLKPRRLLKVISQTLHQRARDAGLPPACELGLLLDNSRLRLRVSRHGTQLLSGGSGRSYLQCSAYQLTQLLLGHLNPEDAITQGRIRASTHVAHRTAVSLFPQLPWWFPPWDLLPAL